ncbi:MAG: Methyltransferase protein [Verrucomicrobia bacterium]|nr:Methyltransferase protein [Verrucomicrobiota bacterium]
MSGAPDFSENIERFTGFADLYDRHRASPPDALAGFVAQFIGPARPALVVDLGSGTGLSTRYWADKAGQVIGVEPAGDMRRQAESVTTAKNVSYRAGFSSETGLPPQSANVVVCMQSLHWMDPAATLAEAARILVPGGAFVACDHDWPPNSGSWEADAAFDRCFRQARKLEDEHRLAAKLVHWDKDTHLQRMQESGRFRFMKDGLLHHRDMGNAERLVGLMLSQGFVRALLKSGITEEEIGIPEFRAVAQRTLGETMRPFYWGTEVRIGVV